MVPVDHILHDVIHDESILKAFSILKLFRVLRLSKLINYMNSTEDIKHSLKLFKLCLFLLIYMHCAACVWEYLDGFSTKVEEKWLPLNSEIKSAAEYE